MTDSTAGSIKDKTSEATSQATSKDAAVASAAPVMTDQAVFDYLKRKGMGTAALELAEVLKKEEALRSTTAVESSKSGRER